MQTFPATLFDYNGVLIDDEAVHLAAFREVLVPLGLPVDEATYWERYIGFDDAGAFSAIFADAQRPCSPALLRELIESKRPVYLRLAQTQLKGFRGAREALELRAKAGPVCIVSGALRDEITLGLKFLAAEACVEHVISAEDTSRSKPDPEGYHMGLAYLATRMDPVLARRALVIEDSLAGVRAAKAARLTCVGVAQSYQESELSAAGADATFPTLLDVNAEALADLYRALYGAS
ncbi:MAG: HAD family phosphatase [Polyangiaceae bacterium]|nr:HAD family phosphatase [Polyangiaceae bacterium]